MKKEYIAPGALNSKIQMAKTRKPYRVSVSKLLKFLDWYVTIDPDTIKEKFKAQIHQLAKKASDYIYAYGKQSHDKFTTYDVITHFKDTRVRLYIPYAKPIIIIALREKAINSVWQFHHKPLSFLGKAA